MMIPVDFVTKPEALSPKPTYQVDRAKPGTPSAVRSTGSGFDLGAGIV